MPRPLAFVFLTLPPLCGCGTVSNMRSDHPIAYGGVAADLKNCKEAFDTPKLPHGWFPGELVLVGGFQTASFAVSAIDMPLSAVGDTVTLPLLQRE